MGHQDQTGMIGLGVIRNQQVHVHMHQLFQIDRAQLLIRLGFDYRDFFVNRTIGGSNLEKGFLSESGDVNCRIQVLGFPLCL